MIRQALPKGVSDHQECALDIDGLHFFAHVFRTFAIEANSKNMFIEIVGNNAMETHSNTILSSNCCFLFETCARDAVSLGASGHVDRVLFSYFVFYLFPKPFFLKMMPNELPNNIKHSMKMLYRTALETKSEKHTEYALKQILLDL